LFTGFFQKPTLPLIAPQHRTVKHRLPLCVNSFPEVLSGSYSQVENSSGTTVAEEATTTPNCGHRTNAHHKWARLKTSNIQAPTSNTAIGARYRWLDE
jgi:hypothetical protein